MRGGDGPTFGHGEFSPAEDLLTVNLTQTMRRPVEEWDEDAVVLGIETAIVATQRGSGRAERLVEEVCLERDMSYAAPMYIRVALVNREADGEWTGRMYSGVAGVSYDARFGRFGIRPSATIEHFKLKEKGYLPPDVEVAAGFESSE